MMKKFILLATILFVLVCLISVEAKPSKSKSPASTTVAAAPSSSQTVPTKPAKKPSGKTAVSSKKQDDEKEAPINFDKTKDSWQFVSYTPQTKRLNAGRAYPRTSKRGNFFLHEPLARRMYLPFIVKGERDEATEAYIKNPIDDKPVMWFEMLEKTLQWKSKNKLSHLQCFKIKCIEGTQSNDEVLCRKPKNPANADKQPHQQTLCFPESRWLEANAKMFNAKDLKVPPPPAAVVAAKKKALINRQKNLKGGKLNKNLLRLEGTCGSKSFQQENDLVCRNWLRGVLAFSPLQAHLYNCDKPAATASATAAPATASSSKKSKKPAAGSSKKPAAGSFLEIESEDPDFNWKSSVCKFTDSVNVKSAKVVLPGLSIEAPSRKTAPYGFIHNLDLVNCREASGFDAATGSLPNCGVRNALFSRLNFPTAGYAGGNLTQIPTPKSESKSTYIKFTELDEKGHSSSISGLYILSNYVSNDNPILLLELSLLRARIADMQEKSKSSSGADVVPDQQIQIYSYDQKRGTLTPLLYPLIGTLTSSQSVKNFQSITCPTSFFINELSNLDAKKDTKSFKISDECPRVRAAQAELESAAERARIEARAAAATKQASKQNKPAADSASTAAPVASFRQRRLGSLQPRK